MREEYKEAHKAGGFGLLWLIIIIVAVSVIGAVIWGVTVATSQIKGQGDAVIEQNSSDNWIAAQAKFEDMYADIVATDRKIQVLYDAAKATPDDKTAQTNYQGTVQYCFGVVGNYNAEARKFLSEEFRAADLPPQISNTDPATDCKENVE